MPKESKSKFKSKKTPTLQFVFKQLATHINTPYVPHPTDGWKFNGVPRPADRKTPMGHSSRTAGTHSMWTMMHMFRFAHTHPGWVRQVDMRLGLWAALLHDIAKGSHCGTTCTAKNGKASCFVDVYADTAYQGRGDGVHPGVSASIIMGRTNMYTKCAGASLKRKLVKAGASKNKRLQVMRQWRVDQTKKKNYVRLTQDFFTKYGVTPIQRRMLAVTAAMHWEVGNINAGKLTPEQYVGKFMNACHAFKTPPTESLLSMTVALSFADIMAGDAPCPAGECQTLCREMAVVSPEFSQVCSSLSKRDSEAYFTGKNVWVLYGMDKKADSIRAAILRAFGESSTK